MVATPLTAAVVLLLSSLLIGASGAFVWGSQAALMAYNTPQHLVNSYQTMFQIGMQAAFPAGAVIARSFARIAKAISEVFELRFRSSRWSTGEEQRQRSL